MLHIPILRQGRPYVSLDTTTLTHHESGELVAELSLANPGLIARDIRRIDPTALDRLTGAELIDIYHRAAELFRSATLPIGDQDQTFEDYLAQLSATTGMPLTCCRSNADKIYSVLRDIEVVLTGLTRGLDPMILERMHGQQDGSVVSFVRQARVLAAVLPNNSPGVHALWIPAPALRTPVFLKPGREEPWTPWRVIEALAEAGLPRDVLGFYPTDHAGAAEMLRLADRSMLFGAGATTRPYEDDPRVEIHGPGFSKIILGPDAAPRWEDHVDVIASSITANAGRSCINASGVWIAAEPTETRPLAEALANRLGQINALPAAHPDAQLAAFADPRVAEAISATIDRELRNPGAEDLTERIRGRSRLVRQDRSTYLLPTVIHCTDHGHPLANREFLFPYAAVVPCDAENLPSAIGPTLIATVITDDPTLKSRLTATPNIDRLNLGPIPTWKIRWDQPHEGNLFEHLYRRRALQMAPAPC